MLSYNFITDYKECINYCIQNNKNPRFNIQQFTKFIPLTEGVKFYGLYDNDVLKCVSVINTKTYFSKCIYLQGIQCLEKYKGYGKKLIDNICNLDKYFYLLCNPESENSLYEYYKKNYPFFKYFTITNSVWNKPATFFYKIFDKKTELMFLEKITKDYSL